MWRCKVVLWLSQNFAHRGSQGLDPWNCEIKTRIGGFCQKSKEGFGCQLGPRWSSEEVGSREGCSQGQMPRTRTAKAGSSWRK